MPDTVIRLWKKGDDAAELRNEGVAMDEKVEEYKYDKLGWIMGPEGEPDRTQGAVERVRMAGASRWSKPGSCGST